jgi:hypothetical protein
MSAARLVEALSRIPNAERRAIALGLRSALFTGPSTVSFDDREAITEYLGEAFEQAEEKARQRATVGEQETAQQVADRERERALQNAAVKAIADGEGP